MSMSCFIQFCRGTSAPPMLRRTLGARTWASLAWLLGPLVMTAPRASSEPAAQAQPNLLAAPTPTPVPAARIPVAQPDEVPRLITGVRPQYPPEYAGKQVEGRILVDFIVRTDGTAPCSNSAGHEKRWPAPELSAACGARCNVRHRFRAQPMSWSATGPARPRSGR